MYQKRFKAYFSLTIFYTTYHNDENIFRCQMEEAGGIQRLTEFKKKVHVGRLSGETRDGRSVDGPHMNTEVTDVITTESDSKEAFINPKMGGLAFRLPHGSLLLKVARHELHATTALNVPN